MSSKFPRKYDALFALLFDTYLNIPSSKTILNLENFIFKFEKLFKDELAASFGKYEKYLTNLHNDYVPSADKKLN